MMDGKTVRNMWSVIPKKNKFDTLVHLVGFTIEIYYDARPYERQELCIPIFQFSPLGPTFVSWRSKSVSLILREGSKMLFLSF